MPPAGAGRRFFLLLVLGCGLVSILFISTFRAQPQGAQQPGSVVNPATAHHNDISSDTLTGHVIAPRLGNETIKAELGRAAWKVLHTTFARFPDEPTQDEKTALQSYIHLFQRLYPCGECAQHFSLILEKYPPQVSSRSAAAAWGCHVHNEVNKRLHKDLFDCSKIGDFYDCGCADDEETASGDKKASTVSTNEKPKTSAGKEGKLSGDNGRKPNVDHNGDEPLKLEKEPGWTNGG